MCALNLVPLQSSTHVTFLREVTEFHGVRWTLKSGGLGGGRNRQKVRFIITKIKKIHIFPKIWGGGRPPPLPPPAADPMLSSTHVIELRHKAHKLGLCKFYDLLVVDNELFSLAMLFTNRPLTKYISPNSEL